MKKLLIYAISLCLLFFPLIISDGFVPRYIHDLPLPTSKQPLAGSQSPSARSSFIAMQREAFEASKDLYIDMGIIPEHKDKLFFTSPFQEKLLALPEQHTANISTSTEPSKPLPHFQDIAPLFITTPHSRKVNTANSALLSLANNHASAGGALRSSGSKGTASPAAASSGSSSAGSSGNNAMGSGDSGGSAGSSDATAQDDAAQEEQINSPTTDLYAGETLNEPDTEPSTEPGTGTDTGRENALHHTNDPEGNHIASSESQADKQQHDDNANTPPDEEENVSYDTPQTEAIYEVMSNAQTPPSTILLNQPINPDTPRANQAMQTIIPEPSTLWLFMLLPFAIWLSSKRPLLCQS
ncbi:hypothetical protein ACFFLZ_14380 [Photobacterium aphoticum]|uniref:Uncharacterized protein n=1 Tax=Photobacterium aphoticum TaxID=754436 RepID=A0A0J1GLA5_9GAMM|nr:hypothetical protein [Photobacterium aphoticum]KLV00493.1 hypothetical protein ABT58_12640 [Photobacterium aphoticum]PSU59846.1 hypothetical protein C9I90_02475 [Photobacterium aphoticum]